MDVSSVILTGKNLKTLKTAQAAVAIAFPDAKARVVNNLSNVLADANPSRLFILADPALDDLTSLERTFDEFQLNRWPAIVLGASPKRTPFPVLEEELWVPASMAMMLKLLVEQHALKRENARLKSNLLTFATRVSHDLRRPLGAIVITSELLKEMMETKLPSEIPLADSVLRSAEELGQTMERTFFVLKALARPPAINPVNMSEVISEVLRRLKVNDSQPIKLPKEWPRVKAIANWLEVIWWNLIKNALQHAGATPRIELGWREEAGQYRFWVKDNGRMAPLKAERLFPNFHSLHESGSVHSWGLAIVRQLVESQNGRCGYEAASDGSIFFFTIPIVTETPERISRIPKSNKRRKRS